jgi:aminopeptidase N
MLDAHQTPQPILLKDYRPPAWRIGTVDLTFDLHAAETRVTNVMSVAPATANPGDLMLDVGEGVEIISVAVNDQALAPADYARTPTHLVMAAPSGGATLTIVTRINPQANTQLMGLYMSGGAFCTQCEAEGFRRITPFLDRPDVMATYRVTLRADKAAFPVLLANGNPVAARDLDDGRHEAVWDDPHPKPCYLFAVVAGQLEAFADQFTTRSGRVVALNIWVAPADLDRCAHAMAALKRSMLWDEQVYGREYDLDVFNIVAVGDFNFGAMENKGLNIFNSKYVLAKPETATDMDFDAVEGVIAHEYFHNWTGNRVTCRDWFQLSLKEGLTVYRDQEFSADMGSRPLKRIEDVRTLRAIQLPEDASPLAHPVRPESYIEISNFYTATVYNKGAEVIRMMATLLGPQRFRAGMDLYFERHDGQAVTCEDFVRAMEDAGGIDLGQFRRWYAQAGTPRVAVSLAHDPRTAIATLTFTQTIPDTPGQTAKQPMHIPIRMALLGAASGQALPVGIDGGPAAPEHLLEVREARQVVRVTGVTERPVPSLLRGYSAPIILEVPINRSDLAFLSAHDDDPFNRFEALQRLALTAVQEQIAARAKGASAITVDPLLIDAFGRTLTDTALDPALVAEAVLLPTEAYIGDQMTQVDVDGIHAVRQAFRKTLSAKLFDRWRDVYHANSDAAYAFTREAKARRRLKNVALQYLMAGDDHEATATAYLQFCDADNMTDQIAALSALASSNAVERPLALDQFYQRWAGDALVIDKWFSLQAFSLRPDTLGQVMALTRHPAFTIANPNRLRSLVGAFSANQARFHDASGAGYRYLADQVLSVDPLNAQTAARLVAPLGRWRRFEPARAALMRAQLERIAAHPGLSKDVFEMASKSLA